MLAGLTFILKPLREGINKEERKSPKKGARQLGAGDGTNTDEFLEKFQGGITFNPIFSPREFIPFDFVTRP